MNLLNWHWFNWHWPSLNWLNFKWLNVIPRSRAVRIAAATAILFCAPPAWTQNQGAGNAPNPENALNPSTFAGFLARFSRPQTAQAAPRTSQKQIQKQVHRVRSSPKAPIAAAAPEAPAPQMAAAEPQPELPDWPNAQDNVGSAGLVPVVVKTVREMVEEAEAALVAENNLNDLDLAAPPVARSEALRDDIVTTTDGRSNADEAEWRGNHITAFAENLKAIGAASWLEPMLLMLAGAVAGLTATRLFAM